jgi:hypothetical protein
MFFIGGAFHETAAAIKRSFSEATPTEMFGARSGPLSAADLAPRLASIAENYLRVVILGGPLGPGVTRPPARLADG